MEITKEKFILYEKVRQSGITNMFMINNVCDLTDLSREEVIAIMNQYSELNKKYPEVRQTNYYKRDEDEESDYISDLENQEDE